MDFPAFCDLAVGMGQLVFEGETPEGQAVKMLTAWLPETLPIPVLNDWNRQLWEAARSKDLVFDLQTCGDCQEGYVVQLSEMTWKEVVIGLMNERKVVISVTVIPEEPIVWLFKCG